VIAVSRQLRPGKLTKIIVVVVEVIVIAIDVASIAVIKIEAAITPRKKVQVVKTSKPLMNQLMISVLAIRQIAANPRNPGRKDHVETVQATDRTGRGIDDPEINKPISQVNQL